MLGAHRVPAGEFSLCEQNCGLNLLLPTLLSQLGAPSEASCRAPYQGGLARNEARRYRFASAIQHDARQSHSLTVADLAASKAFYTDLAGSQNRKGVIAPMMII